MTQCKLKALTLDRYPVMAQEVHGPMAGANSARRTQRYNLGPVLCKPTKKDLVGCTKAGGHRC